MKAIIYAVLLLLAASAARAQDPYYNVVKYGARNDSTKPLYGCYCQSHCGGQQGGRRHGVLSGG